MKYQINRYLVVQLYAYLLLGVFVFISALLILQMLRLSEFLVVYDVSLIDLFLLLSFMSVSFFPIVIPTAMVFSTFSVFGRFVEKREWLGILTCGVGYRRILFPVLAYFALPLSVLCLVVGLNVVPWASQQVDLTAEQIYNKKSLTSVRRNVFFNLLDGMVMFVGGFDSRSNQIQKIFLYDERNPSTPVTIIAKSGQMRRNVGERAFKMDFKDGVVQSHNLAESTLRTMRYEDLQVQAKMEHETMVIFPVASSLDLKTLENRIEQLDQEGRPPLYYEFLVDYHRRFALPVAGFMFVLLGIALSLSAQKRYFRLSPIIQSFIVLLIYWVVYVVNNLLTFQGYLSAGLGLWVSVLLFFALSCQQLFSKRVMF